MVGQLSGGSKNDPGGKGGLRGRGRPRGAATVGIEKKEVCHIPKERQNPRKKKKRGTGGGERGGANTGGEETRNAAGKGVLKKRYV